MDSTPVLYEERHGWNRSVVLTVSIGCLFGIASLIGFAELHLVRLLLIGSLATAGALLNVLSAVVHRVVVRVDEQGLTLARAAARTPSGGGTAWAEVRAVVIRKIAGKTHIGLVKKYAGIPRRCPAVSVRRDRRGARMR
ncbi:MAG TPA: hypothetical protein VFN97_12440 [Actinospica sp.]|nr:hypothetical protein [Actinospica sp.]